MAIALQRLPASLSGYTLLELLVVVALMGLLIGLVPTRMGAGGGAELRAAARSIAAGLKQARATAVGQRIETVFQLDLTNKKFMVTGDAREHQLPKEVELKLFTGQQEVITDKVGGIRFYPDGGATGGRVTVFAGEQKFEIDVDWMTGRISTGS